MGISRGCPNFLGQFTGPIRIKTRKKLWRKGSVGVSRGCPNFWVPPIISGTAKATDSNFVGTFIGSIGTKPHEKFWEQQPWAQSGSPENFQGTHVYGALRGHLCDSTAFTMKFLTDFTYRNLHGFARFPGDSTALVNLSYTIGLQSVTTRGLGRVTALCLPFCVRSCVLPNWFY